MARYVGYMPVLGTIGNLTFARGENGEIQVRQRSSLSGERILHDASFKRTRENMQEFSRAGKAGSLLLRASREVALSKPGRRIMPRLVKACMAVIGSDSTNVLGGRTMVDGNLTLLRDFEFSDKASLPLSFYGSYAGSIERLTGEVDMVIPSYNPEEMVMKPEGATHFRLVTGGAEIDFAGAAYIRAKAVSGWIPWANIPTAPLTLSCTLTPNSTLPIIQLFAIEYAKERNGVKYHLEDGAFNAAVISGVSVVS